MFIHYKKHAEYANYSSHKGSRQCRNELVFKLKLKLQSSLGIAVDPRTDRAVVFVNITIGLCTHVNIKTIE